MIDADPQQDQLIRRLAPTFQLPPGAEDPSGVAAGELLDGILRTSAAPQRGRSRLLIAVPVAAALAVLVFVASALLPTSAPVGPAPARAALGFTPVDGYLVITIKDPDADPQRYRDELAQHGLNIELSLAPAAPDEVGKIIFGEYGDTGTGPKIEPIESPGNCTANGNCDVGIRVPVTFTSYARIVFGRTPKPGESVEGDAPVLTQEQRQQLRDLVGKRVSEARKILAARGQTIEYRVGWESLAAPADQVPGTWYVTDISPLTSTSVAMWVNDVNAPPSPPAPPSAQPSVGPSSHD